MVVEKQLLPTVAARSGEVVVAWQEFADGRSDDRGRIMLARLDERGRKHGADVRVDDTDAGGKWLAQVALDGDVPVVAWIDERDHGPQDLPLEHVYAARGTAGGGFGANVRVDAGAPERGAVEPPQFFVFNFGKRHWMPKSSNFTHPFWGMCWLVEICICRGSRLCALRFGLRDRST